MIPLHDALRKLRNLVVAGHKLRRELPDIAGEFGINERILRERWLLAYKSEASVRAFARATDPNTAARCPFSPEAEREAQGQYAKAVLEAARQRKLLKQLGKPFARRRITTVHYWDVPWPKYFQRRDRASKIRGDGRW